MLPLQLKIQIDVKLMSKCVIETIFSQGTSTTVGNPIVAMVADLLCNLTYNWSGACHTDGIQRMTCFSPILSEMLLKSTIVENCDFLKLMIHSQII